METDVYELKEDGLPQRTLTATKEAFQDKKAFFRDYIPLKLNFVIVGLHLVVMMQPVHEQAGYQGC